MLIHAGTVVQHLPSVLFEQLSLQVWTNHVVTKNFAEYITESRTFFFYPACGFRNSKVKLRSAKQIIKRVHNKIMKKTFKEMLFLRCWNAQFLRVCMTEIRFPHPYAFTSPSCVWTSWNTCFSLCPGCLCGICNMTNIKIHQYLQWFVTEGVLNVPTAYIATFLSRLLMSLSKGFFAWALMRHSWAVWYSCSSM